MAEPRARVKINQALLGRARGGAAKQKQLPCATSLVAFTLGGGRLYTFAATFGAQ